MSTYYECPRCKRPFSRPDAFILEYGDIQLQAAVAPEWCPHCLPNWRDLIRGADVIGSRQYQKDRSAMDDGALLRELHEQQDAAARWAPRMRYVWIAGERWQC